VAASVFVGASSWAERGLVACGRFYPPEVKDSDARLAYFATMFSLAEVDSTYYALPSRRNTERWSAAVPDGFRFNVKAHALFTQHPARLSSIPRSFHEALPPEALNKARLYYKDVPPEVRDEMWTIFARGLGPMRAAGKLGAVLIDFPPWHVPNDANRDYIAEARRHLPDDRVIVQFRNRLWLDDGEDERTFSHLRELDCGYVCVDEPPGFKSALPPLAAVTSKKAAAVRFRGRNAESWDAKGAGAEQRLNWLYSEEELSEWLPRIEMLTAEAEEVYLAFNTKGEDQGVLNAQLLQRLLGLT
jgi:uncharacterized protein YecE (DUF72 family)